MKYLLTAMLLCGISAQIAAHPSSLLVIRPTVLAFICMLSGGDWAGDINGAQSTMRLHQHDAELRGTIDTEGYLYEVAATVQGDQFSGRVHDPKANGNIPCRGVLNGDHVRITFSTRNQYTGQEEVYSLEFSRSAGQQTAPGEPLNARRAGGSGWPGQYSGNINGTVSTMQLDEKDGQLSGTINAGGYMYQVSGTVDGNAFEGQVFDPQTQGTLQCRGLRNGEQVQLVIVATDQFTGQQQELQLDFTRDSGSGAEVGGTVAGGNAAGTAGSAEYQRDPSLVGNWLYSESYTSGSYGFASQWRLIINADGSYLYGDGKVAGGGPGVGGQSGGGEYTRGRWGTRNGTIYINEGQGWQPYAGYYVEGASMLMKFADGSKQVWKRTY